MRVYERVAEVLWELGVAQVFGVAGSGNYAMTQELMRRGAMYTSARHEGAAVSMADAFARSSDLLPVVSVHQGGGVTNLITGLTEAAKSSSPLIVLAAEAPLSDRFSNFRVDQPRLAEAVGANSVRVNAVTVTDDVRHAYRIAITRRTPVVLNVPTDVQAAETIDEGPVEPVPAGGPVRPDADSVRRIADLLLDARNPLIVGGRGARQAKSELARLAELCGALVATSAVARGLFHGDEFNLDVMGDLATPLASEMVLASDVIVAFGCGLGNWTTSNGSLLPQNVTLVQVDTDPLALGRHRPVAVGAIGDSAETAAAIAEHIPSMDELTRKRRTRTNRQRIAEQGRWQRINYRDRSNGERIDPRTATIAIDGMADSDRNVAIDSGNFLGYPSMFLTIPDVRSLCFSQAFQCVGLGLASAIGHAHARPDRLTIAGCGDGGTLMASSELETIVRLGLHMMVLVYNDSAYGAEEHHFGQSELDHGFITFDDVDFASIAAGYGFEAVTVRTESDLIGVQSWLESSRQSPLLVDLKITRMPAWWLADAFKAEYTPIQEKR